jgi:hypothetical protein
MPDIDLGALTIPIFSTIFGAGWAACYAVVVRPLSQELQSLKAKVEESDRSKDDRIRLLEKKVGLWTD